MRSKSALSGNGFALISNKIIFSPKSHPHSTSTTMSSSSFKMSGFTPLSPGAEEFRELLGLRVHPVNGLFYCGAPPTTEKPTPTSSSIPEPELCYVLLSLEDSLMWRETLEIWHQSRNLLDSAIYKWAAGMLCKKHRDDEQTQDLLWAQVKSRLSGSKYVTKKQQNGNGKGAVWPTMRGTEDELRGLQEKVAIAEAKVVELGSEKSRLAKELLGKEMDIEAMRRLRMATEQGVAQREGALTELRCRNDELQSHSDALAKKVEEHERGIKKKEEAVKDLVLRIEESKMAEKELKQKLEEANRELAETKGALKELRAENHRLNERYEGLALQMKDWQDTVIRQDGTLKHAETKSKELSEEVKNLRQFRDDTRARLAEQDGALKELRRDNMEYKEHNASISDQLATARHIIGSHEKELARSKSETVRPSTIGDDVQRKDLEVQSAELISRTKGSQHEMEGESRKVDKHRGDSKIEVGFEEQISDLGTKLKRSEEESDNLRANARELMAKVKDLDAQMEASVTEITDLNTEKNSLSSQLSDAHTGLEQHKFSSTETSEKSSAEMEAIRNETRELKAQVKDLEAKLSVSETSLTDLDKEKLSLSSQLSSVQVELEQHKSKDISSSNVAKEKLATYEREATQARQKRDTLAAQIEDLEVQLKNHQDEAARWTTEKAELAKRVRDVEGQVEFEKSQNAFTSEKTRKELDESHTKSANILNQLVDLQAKHEDTKAQHQAVMNELEQSRNQQAQFKDRHSNFSNEIRDLQRKLEDQTSRYDAAAKELDDWQAENEELSTANQDLSNKLSKLKESNALHTEKIEALERAETRLDEAQVKTKDLENDKKRMFRQLEILKAELDEERVRHQADLSARQRASQRAEQSMEPSIEPESPASSSKRKSRVWRKFSRRSVGSLE